MAKLHFPVVKLYAAEALVEVDAGVKDALTLKDKFGETYTLYRASDDGSAPVWVPRGLVDRSDAEEVILSTQHVEMPTQYAPPQTKQQAECIAKSINCLMNGQDHIVEAPTGFGKSYVGAAVACGMNETTLIVVTKNDLVKSWRTTLTELFGVLPSEIGHVQQNVCDYKGKKFVVAMIHSLVGRDYGTAFYHHFGLVIFDEVHRLGAETFGQACRLFNSRYRLGLSATPKRSDGKEQMFEAHIGPVLVKGTWVPMTPKVLVKTTGWKVPSQQKRVGNDWVMMPMDVVPGMMMNVLKHMAGNAIRNAEIVRFTKSALDAGRTTVIMSDLIESHLTPLFHLLVAAGIPGQDIGYYIGSCSAQELEATKTRKVVLATYAMCSEGTNVPRWDTLVMATPRANVKQPVGRILRLVEGKKQPVVLDLVDNHGVLKNFHYARLKQ